MSTLPPAGTSPSRGTVIGLAVGAVLGLTWLQFGFGRMLLVVVLMALGALVARVLDGTVDLRRLADVLRGRTRDDL